jgi:hypothetical protein
MRKTRALLLIATLMAGGVSGQAGEDKVLVIDFRQTLGKETTAFRITHLKHHSRIERILPASSLSPVNLIDHESGTVTLITPHNHSYSTFPLEGRTASPPASPTPVAPPTPPSLPLPTGPMTPPAGPPPAVPGPPERTLTGHDETREIHGHTCHRFTLAAESDTEIELWLCDDPAFPPFHLLRANPHGPEMPIHPWEQLVRQAGKFPFLVTQRHRPPELPDLPPGHPALSRPRQQTTPEDSIIAQWEVSGIQHTKPDPAAFAIPKGFLNADD